MLSYNEGKAMSPKTRNAIGWIIMGIVVIASVIYAGWGSPYGTTRWIQFSFIMLTIYCVTYNIAVGPNQNEEELQ